MLGSIHEKIDLFFSHYQSQLFKRRDLMLRSDDIGSNIYHIKQGFVRAFRISEEGEELTLLILKPYDFFPMTYGLNHMPNIYYLEAITPLEVTKAPREAFLAFLKKNPDVFFFLSTLIMDRFDGMLARMEYMVWSRAYTKVAATLLICGRRFGEEKHGKTYINVPLTHKDIATLIGITRETTSIEMKKLEKKGIIGKSGKNLIIYDRKRLEEESLLNNQEALLQNNFL